MNYITHMQTCSFLKDNLYFSARYTPGEEQSFGYELYKLNPLQQTELVMDINPTGNANPWIVGGAGDWLIFSAVTGTGERTMWRTNNIPGGIYQVPPIQRIGRRKRLGSLGDRLLFASGGVLWAIDGPSGNTYLISAVPEHKFLVWASYGNKLYYSGGDFFTGTEIMVTDGISVHSIKISILAFPVASRWRWRPAVAACVSLPMTVSTAQRYGRHTAILMMYIW